MHFYAPCEYDADPDHHNYLHFFSPILLSPSTKEN